MTALKLPPGGTTGQVLVIDPASPYGCSWADAALGAPALTATRTGHGALTLSGTGLSRTGHGAVVLPSGTRTGHGAIKLTS